MKELKEIVTIDGPAGSGKSTAAFLVARELDAILLDTGAIYRCVALVAEERGVSEQDAHALAEMARTLEISFQNDLSGGSSGRVFVDGRDVTEKIRTPRVSSDASKISAYPKVRAALLQLQRRQAWKDLNKDKDVIVSEGRDMGTVVFPDAPHKFFLVADAETRAERRYKELVEKGSDVSYAQVLADQKERDRRDEQRQASPLRPAEDACTVDTTKMGLSEVVEVILKQISNNRKKPNVGRTNR